MAILVVCARDITSHAFSHAAENFVCFYSRLAASHCTMASASDHSSDSENETPIAKKKKSTGAKADSDDFSFKNVLRPPRSTTYTAQALYGTLCLRSSVLPLPPSNSNAVI